MNQVVKTKGGEIQGSSSEWSVGLSAAFQRGISAVSSVLDGSLHGLRATTAGPIAGLALLGLTGAGCGKTTPQISEALSFQREAMNALETWKREGVIASVIELQGPMELLIQRCRPLGENLPSLEEQCTLLQVRTSRLGSEDVSMKDIHRLEATLKGVKDAIESRWAFFSGLITGFLATGGLGALAVQCGRNRKKS